MIKLISDKRELRQSVPGIRTSFKTVADEFHLTEENCPTNPAFIDLDGLISLMEKGAEFFGLYEEDELIGFGAVEKADESTFYLEKLAVLPEHRHKGHGERIVEFACNHVKDRRGKKLSIGIIDEHIVLKEWYKTLGFIETDVKRFGHLPFTVCFMEKRLISS